MNKSAYAKTAAAVLSASLLFGCSNQAVEESAANGTKEAAAAAEETVSLLNSAVTYSEEDEYTEWDESTAVKITLSGDTAEFDSSDPVLFQDGVLTLKTGGTYVISGTLDDGQIAVDAEDKKTVRIVLNGVDISSSQSAAINILNAEKAVISLAEGTENHVADGEEYVFEDASEDEPNAAIFSKSDLTINGSGSLTVEGNYNNGITGKDDLKVTGGDIHITAVDDGLQGRDLVAVRDGDFTIEAGGDGIKTTNDEDLSKAVVALEGGTFNITAGKDGIQSENSLLVAGGDYTVVSGGGSPETVASTGERMEGMMSDSASSATEETESTKGLKAAADITVSGGTFSVDSLDDAVHSNGDVTISGGEWALSTGDDGVHADGAAAVSGGEVQVVKSTEGMEGANVSVEGGTVKLTAADDGMNVNSAEGVLSVGGGFVSVDAQGDGIDSNGSIAMTGGTLLVNGPTESMNGSVDYDGSFELSGGTLIAAGSAGMLQAISDGSSQPAVVMTYPESQEAGSLVALADSEGGLLAAFTPSKSYQAVLISTPDLAEGASYSIFSGGTIAGEAAEGLYTEGSLEGGTKIVDFSVSESVTWLDENGVTDAQNAAPGGGGMPGGGGGTRPEGGGMGSPFGDLDEETREKVEAIMEQQRDGAITMEQAQQQLSDLGISMERN